MVMFPPEPSRTLTLPRSLWMLIFALAAALRIVITGLSIIDKARGSSEFQRAFRASFHFLIGVNSSFSSVSHQETRPAAWRVRSCSHFHQECVDHQAARR